MAGCRGPRHPREDPRRFTGKELDPETALHYFGARYYRNLWGRFTSPDPGQASGSVEDPQGWNAYAYARNNPLRFIDLDGLSYTVHIYAGHNTFDVDTDRFEMWMRYPSLNPGLTFSSGPGGNGYLYMNGKEVGYYRFTPDEKRNPYAMYDAIRDAGRRAEMGVSAAFVVSAPNFALAAFATGSALVGSQTMTSLGRLFVSTPGQTGHVQRILAQGGRRALEKSIHSWEKSIATHLEKLATYEQRGSATSDIHRTISNLQGLINAARALLGKAGR